jgi:hypothetical protein
MVERWVSTGVVGPAVGADGHIVVAFERANANPPVYPPPPVKEGLVTEFDASGVALWTWQSGANVQWLGVDGNGNVFVIAWSRVDPHYPNDPGVVLLTKLDATGSFLWSKTIGVLVGSFYGPDVQGPSVGAVTRGGGVVTVVSGGPDAGLPANGVAPVVLTKFGPAGDMLWSRILPGPPAEAAAVSEDPTGDIIVGGSFVQTLDLDGGFPLYGPGEPVFVAKYDASGSFKWSRQYGGVKVSFGGGPRDRVGGIATDAAGNIFITGKFGGAADFGTGPFATPSNGGTEFFAVELDGAGNTVAATRFGDGGAIEVPAPSVAVRESNQIAIAGGFQGSIDFGGGPFVFPAMFCQGLPCGHGFVAAFSR